MQRPMSYPNLAQIIFNSGNDLSPHVRIRKNPKQDVPGYIKAGIPVKNPKIAANIQMMFERWNLNRRTVIQAEPNPNSISTIKLRTGMSRKFIRRQRGLE